MKHGTHHAYKYHGCRCDECCLFVRRYDKRRRIYGGTYVDPAATVAHLKALRLAGLGKIRISRMSGVSKSTLQDLYDGTTTRLWPRTEARILAVPIALTATSFVPVRGSQRRLGALMVMGWTQSEIAARLGWSKHNVSRIMRNITPQIRLYTAEKIAALYEELCMIDGGSGPAKLRAALYGYAPPLAWDDIDNDERPSDWKRGKRPTTLADEIADLRGFGYSTEDIAQRLQVPVHAVNTAERKAG